LLNVMLGALSIAFGHMQRLARFFGQLEACRGPGVQDAEQSTK